MRLRPASLLLLLPLATGSALACSDLPNICAANAAAHEQNVEMGRQAAEAWGAQQYEDSYDDGGDYTDYGSGYGDAGLSYDPMQARLDSAFLLVELAAQTLADLEKAQADPRWQRFLHGGWDFFQDHPGARPGEYCAALYWKGDTLVRLSGPGRDYEGAMITFWSTDIPSPGEVATVPVTLIQSDGRQSVQAFNYRLPNEAMAAIALAVPSLDAALAGIEDTQTFELQMDGRTVAKIEWKDGLTARDRLRECAARR